MVVSLRLTENSSSHKAWKRWWVSISSHYKSFREGSCGRHWNAYCIIRWFRWLWNAWLWANGIYQYGYWQSSGERITVYKRNLKFYRTNDGIFLRFPIKEVPELKKATLGVKGIKLNAEDFVTHVYLLDIGDNEVVEYKGKQVET